MVKKKTDASPVIATPDSYEACDLVIEEIGRLHRNIAGLTMLRDEKIATIKAEYDQTIAGWESTADSMVEAVHAFCAAHRDEMTDGGKRKTYSFAAGEVSWRTRPPSVSLRKVEQIIAHCMEFRPLRRFIRTKHEINKELLLAESGIAATIPGVKIVAGVEDFTVAPFEPKATDSVPRGPAAA